MNETGTSSGNGLMLLLSWTVVGIPLAWGVYNTVLKLPALFQ